MSTPVITVTPKTSVKQAAMLLSSHGFTALPVVDDDGRLIGIVTEADIVKDRFPRDPRYRHAYDNYVADTANDCTPMVAPTVDAAMTASVTAMSSVVLAHSIETDYIASQVIHFPVLPPSRRLRASSRSCETGTESRKTPQPSPKSWDPRRRRRPVFGLLPRSAACE
jgi:CBS domain-containing protein